MVNFILGYLYLKLKNMSMITFKITESEQPDTVCVLMKQNTPTTNSCFPPPPPGIKNLINPFRLTNLEIQGTEEQDILYH